MSERILCQNRKAFHDFEILDTVEAGIVLQGCEVKSLRDHKASLEGAYAFIENGELWLVNSHIDEYKNVNTFTFHEPKRRRKLLLHRTEIRKFAEKATQKGFTIVPLNFHLTHGRVKVSLAIGRGKQLHDKRQDAKKRDSEREIRSQS